MSDKRPELLHTFESIKLNVNSVCFSPNENEIWAIGEGDFNSVECFSLRTKKKIADFFGHSKTINDIDFSKNGTFFATASSDKTVRIWDPESEKGEDSDETFDLLGHQTEVRKVRISPDSEHLVSASLDCVKLWDVEKKASIFTIPGYVHCLDLIQNQSIGTVMVGGRYYEERNYLQIWDIRIKRRNSSTIQNLEIYSEDKIVSVQFSPDSSYLAFCRENQISIHSTKPKLGTIEGRPVRTFSDEGKLSCMGIHPTGNYLLSGSQNTISFYDVYDTTTDSSIFPSKDFENEVRCVKFSPRGNFFCVAGCSSELSIYKISRLNEGVVCKKAEEERVELEKIRLQKMVDEYESRVEVWRKEDFKEYLIGRRTMEMEFEREELEKMRLQAEVDRRSSEEEFVTNRILRKMYGDQRKKSGAEDTKEDISMLKTQQHLHVEQPNLLGEFGHDSKVVGVVCFSSDSSTLFTSNHTSLRKLEDSSKAVVYLWDINSMGRKNTEVSEFSGDVVTALDSHGKFLASGTLSGGIYLQDLINDRVVGKYRHENSVNCLKFSSDGLWMVSGSNHQQRHSVGVRGSRKKKYTSASKRKSWRWNTDEHNISIWDVEKKKVISRMKAQHIPTSSGVSVNDLKILAGDNTVIGGFSDGIRMFDVRSARNVGYFQTRNVFSVDHNFDCTVFASTRERSVIIYDLRKWKLLHKFDTHTSVVRSLSFHPTLNYIISGSFDGTVKMYNVEERRLLYSLGGLGNVFSVQFSPNGEYIAAGGDAQKALLWSFGFERFSRIGQEVIGSESLEKEKEEVEKKVREGSICLKNNNDESINPVLRNDPVFMTKIIELGWPMFKSIEFVSERLRGTKNFVMHFLKKDYGGEMLQYASEILRGDEEVVLQAIRSGYFRALRYASAELRGDKSVVMEAVKVNQQNLKYATDELKNDEEVILEAIRGERDEKKRIRRSHAMKFASNLLKANERFVFEVVKLNCYAFQFASAELRKNKQFALEVISKLETMFEKLVVFRHSDISLQKDLEFVQLLTRKHQLELSICQCLHSSLKNDKEFLLGIMKRFSGDFLVLCYVDEALLDDIEFMKKALEIRPTSAQYASKRLLRTKDFVIHSIRADPSNFFYADERLQKGEEIIKLVEERKKYTNKQKPVRFDFSKDIELFEVIGKGTQGVVYRCKFVTNIYAYKEFKSPKELYFEYSTKIGKFKHPNILGILGYCFSPRSSGLVLEYCSNGDLFSLLKKSKENKLIILPLKTRLRFVKEIVDSLFYLHHEVMEVHSNLNLKSLLVTEKWETRMIGFRRRKVFEEQNSYFLAPEVRNNTSNLIKTSTPKVDVYSFGMILYCLLMNSSEPLCNSHDTNFEQIFKKVVVKNKVKKENEKERRLKKLVLLMEKCLSRNPFQRPSIEYIKKQLKLSQEEEEEEGEEEEEEENPNYKKKFSVGAFIEKTIKEEEEKKKQKIIEEKKIFHQLLETEKEYFSKLREFQKKYVSLKDVLVEEKWKKIFSDFDQLIIPLHCEMAKALKAINIMMDETVDIWKKVIGSFVEKSEGFQQGYLVFFINQISSKKCWREEVENNEKIKKKGCLEGDIEKYFRLANERINVYLKLFRGLRLQQEEEEIDRYVYFSKDLESIISLFKSLVEQRKLFSL